MNTFTYLDQKENQAVAVIECLPPAHQTLRNRLKKRGTDRNLWPVRHKTHFHHGTTLIIEQPRLQSSVFPLRFFHPIQTPANGWKHIKCEFLQEVCKHRRVEKILFGFALLFGWTIEWLLHAVTCSWLHCCGAECVLWLGSYSHADHIYVREKVSDLISSLFFERSQQYRWFIPFINPSQWSL